VCGAEAGLVFCGPTPGSITVSTRSQLQKADLSRSRAFIHNACLTALPAEEMLKVVAKQVWEVKADVARVSLRVGVHSPEPPQRALALKLGRRP